MLRPWFFHQSLPSSSSPIYYCQREPEQGRSATLWKSLTSRTSALFFFLLKELRSYSGFGKSYSLSLDAPPLPRPLLLLPPALLPSPHLPSPPPSPELRNFLLPRLQPASVLSSPYPIRCALSPEARADSGRSAAQ